MKFMKPELEKVLFNDLDVVLQVSVGDSNIIDPNNPDFNESDFGLDD